MPDCTAEGASEGADELLVDYCADGAKERAPGGADEGFVKKRL